MDIDKETLAAARKAVQAKIDWLKEELERHNRMISDVESGLDQRKQQRAQVKDQLSRLEQFMRDTNETPRVCGTCMKMNRCAGARPEKTACGFWARRKEEQE